MDQDNHARAAQNSRGIGLAFLLNLVFACIELVGGVLTNSVAILADAIHDLGDAAALGVAWYTEKVSGKGRDARHSYGYRRYSILGAIVNALVLVAGSIFVLREAILRLSAPEDVHAPGMIALAVLGIVVNTVAFRKLHGEHSHNVSVVRLHLLEDVLGWVIVLVGAVCIYFWELIFLDPLLSILIGLFILWQVLKRLRESVRIVMQAVPSQVDMNAVVKGLKKIREVKDLHDVHIWTMDGEYHVLTIHLVVPQEKTMRELTEIKRAVRRELKKMEVDHATIEFEYPGEECGFDDC
jgi:cobalt-zinc-cadmium efflux system protein